MKNKNFLIIVIGQIISLFGNAIQRFSMSLYLLEFTGSTAAFANILAISTIPYVIFAPIAGKIADSVNRKRIMIYLDLFASVVVGIYAITLFNNRDSEFIIGIVMFLLSICYTLYSPAVTSAIPQVVTEDKLTSANGIINQVGSIVNFAGPIVAGIIYGLIGIRFIVVLNAISFLLSACMELFLHIPDVNTENDERIISLDFIKNSFLDMKRSYVYLKTEKQTIMWVIVSYACCNIFLVPILSIVAPYFINVLLELPSQIYGIVESICVLGMILGGLWISLKPNKFSMNKVHKTYYPMIAGSIIIAIIGIINIDNYSKAFIFAIGGMAIMLSLALSNVLTLTFIQKEVDYNRLGRIMAFSNAIATISVAPGQLLFGQIIEVGVPLEVIFLISVLMNIMLMLFIKINISNSLIKD